MSIALAVSAARQIVIKKTPYMARLLYTFVARETADIDTMCVTDKGEFMANPKYVSALTTEELAGDLFHECLHVMGRHIDRMNAVNADPQLGNTAADMAINPAVWAAGFTMAGGRSGVTPEHPFHALYPQEYGWEEGRTFEEYYNLLRALPANKRPKTGGSHQGNCGSCAGPRNPKESKDGPNTRTKAEISAAIRSVAEEIRAAAARSSGGRGTIPAQLLRWAEEILDPPEVDWRTELAVLSRYAIAWVSNAVYHRYDAPSRRQAGIGYGPGKPILPRLRAPVPHVAVIFDTSGSMGAQELGEAGREARGIFKAMGAEITFCACDASVNELRKVRSLEEALASMKGGGGTDMRPALEALRAARPRPDVIVCLTDFAIGDIGEEMSIPVIWVGVGQVAQTQPDPAWGRVVRTTSARKAKHTTEPEGEDDDF